MIDKHQMGCETCDRWHSWIQHLDPVAYMILLNWAKRKDQGLEDPPNEFVPAQLMFNCWWGNTSSLQISFTLQRHKLASIISLIVNYIIHRVVLNLPQRMFGAEKVQGEPGLMIPIQMKFLNSLYLSSWGPMDDLRRCLGWLACIPWFLGSQEVCQSCPYAGIHFPLQCLFSSGKVGQVAVLQVDT